MTTETPLPRWEALLARIPAWAGDLLAVAVVIVTSVVPGPRPPGPHGMSPALLTAVILAAVVLVPLRRRWPIPVLALSLALYCATVALKEPSTGVGIVAVLAAFSVGARTSRMITLIAGGIATAIVAALSVTIATFGVVDPRVFQVAAAIAVAAALGDSSRSHREFLRVAEERALRAEQTREAEARRRVAEERLRIAQDLHDTVAHQISVISLNAGVASGALDGNPDKARAALGTIRTASREVLSEIGNLLRYLRTDAESATTPPQPGLDDLDALIDRLRESGLDIRVHREGDPGRVTASAGRVAYRVIQESLTNAHKHGAEGAVTMDITIGEDEMTVTVVNPVTTGRAEPSDDQSSGLGLTGIRERVASIGGVVHTDDSEGSFALVARLPLRKEAGL